MFSDEFDDGKKADTEALNEFCQEERIGPEDLFLESGNGNSSVEAPHWTEYHSQRLEAAAKKEDFESMKELASQAVFPETDGRHAFYNNGRENRAAAEIAAKECGHFTLEQTKAGADFDRVAREYSLREKNERETNLVFQELSGRFANETCESAFVFERNGREKSIFNEVEAEKLQLRYQEGTLKNLISDSPEWKEGHGPLKKS